jgi:hypothetical protein
MDCILIAYSLTFPKKEISPFPSFRVAPLHLQPRRTQQTCIPCALRLSQFFGEGGECFDFGVEF